MVIISLLLLFLAIMIYGFIKSYKAELKNVALSNIRNQYLLVTNIRQKMEPEIVYYWNAETKKNYINGLLISTDEKGVYMKGGLMQWWFKLIFISWNDMEIKGEMRWMFFIKLNIYYIKSVNSYIAFPKKHDKQKIKGSAH